MHAYKQLVTVRCVALTVINRVSGLFCSVCCFWCWYILQKHIIPSHICCNMQTFINQSDKIKPLTRHSDILPSFSHLTMHDTVWRLCGMRYEAFLHMVYSAVDSYRRFLQLITNIFTLFAWAYCRCKGWRHQIYWTNLQDLRLKQDEEDRESK